MMTGILSVLTLTACKKDETVTAQKSIEQERLEFQARQLEIEKQKLAIEKEKIAFEKAKDSIAKSEKEKQASIARSNAASSSKQRVVTRTVYRDAPSSSSSNGAYANNGSGQATQQKQGMSKAAKGTIIGTVGGAAAGAIINKRNRGAGAVIGGIVGGATGYTIGRSQDRKDGRVQR